MRQVADCVPYQGKNTHFCLGMAQAISASIIYGIRFRPFSNNIAKQPTATTWILSAYISFLWHKLCHTRLKTPIFALVWHTIEDETAP